MKVEDLEQYTFLVEVLKAIKARWFFLVVPMEAVHLIIVVLGFFSIKKAFHRYLTGALF